MVHHLIGIGLIVLSMLCFSITYALYKACSTALSDIQIIAIQNFFSWLLILPFVLRKGKEMLVTDRLPMIVLRTAVGIVSLYCFLRALGKISLSEAVLLNNTSPLFVPFIFWAWHRTKIPHRQWSGLVLGFIGIFLILKPGFQEINPGALFALASGVAGGLLLVVMKQIAHEPFLRILFYYFLFFWVILGPIAGMNWIAPSPEIWLYLVLAGVMMVCAQYTVIGGLRYISSYEAAPFIYTGVIFAGLIDWLIWGVTLHSIAVIGMAIVCLGCILTSYLGRKRPSHDT